MMEIDKAGEGCNPSIFSPPSYVGRGQGDGRHDLLKSKTIYSYAVVFFLIIW